MEEASARPSRRRPVWGNLTIADLAWRGVVALMVGATIGIALANFDDVANAVLASAGIVAVGLVTALLVVYFHSARDRDLHARQTAEAISREMLETREALDEALRRSQARLTELETALGALEEPSGRMRPEAVEHELMTFRQALAQLYEGVELGSVGAHLGKRTDLRPEQRAVLFEHALIDFAREIWARDLGEELGHSSEKEGAVRKPPTP